jgi:Subtilase family
MEGGNSVSQHSRGIHRPAAKLLALLPVAVFFLSAAGEVAAFERRAGLMPVRQAVTRPAAPNFGRSANPFGRGGNPFARGSGEQGPIQGRPNDRLHNNEAARNEASLEHRNPAGDLGHRPGASGLRNGSPIGGFRGGPGSPRGGGGPGSLRGGGAGGFRNPPPLGFARNGLPQRPFPGEAGFTGVPPRGETRFISNEMVFHVASGVAPQTVDAAARRLGLIAVSSQSLTLSGGTLFHFRIDNGRPVPDVVRDLEAENIGVAQPNYVYHLQQDAHAPASLTSAPALPRGDPAQYVVRKLRLPEVHKIATGANVLVAVIDSQVDTAHPDLNGAIAGQFDAAKSHDRPDEHGTEMTGAIVAHRKLLGIAPRARILAIHAFSPDSQTAPQTTTEHILAGIEWAIAKGARVINMSFAGPYDPMLSIALKKAHEKKIVLIAAAGNEGPDSPPLYPAADENVIAVTAIDENDKLLPQANQGAHIAVAAPGVSVLGPAPGSSYGFTTGTSVAAAHVSGVAALIIERDPTIDVATLEDVLYSTARDLGPKGRDSQFGYGLVDPLRALNSLDAKVAMNNTSSLPTPPPLRRSILVSAPEKMTVSQASPRETLSNPQQVNQAALSPAPASQPPVTTIGRAAANSLPANRAQANLPPAAQPLANRAPANQIALAPGPGVTNSGTEYAPVAEKKRMAACLQQGTAKGMRGFELRDFTVVCVAEARLTCLKQAVAQKLRGQERKEFIGHCLGS